MLVSLAMISDMPIEEPRLRISVQIAVPSVRNSPGKVAKAMVFSGTNTKPRPKPCATLSIAIARAEVSGDQPTITHSEPVARTSPKKIRSARVEPAEQAADRHHREERADAARAEQEAARQHGIAHQILHDRASPAPSSRAG